MPRMNPRSVQTAKGSRITRCVRTSAHERGSSGRTCARTTKSGMTRPACGSMRIPITSTTKSLLPVKRYFASATAARNATTTESTTTTPTTIRLFFTVSQKYGPARSRRGSAAASDPARTRSEGSELISESGLKAVETIQNTGKTRTTNTASPTTFHAIRRARRAPLAPDRRRGEAPEHPTS